MRSASAPLAHAFRALTALVTVWCLGCSAFEPILGGGLASSAGPVMTCASAPDSVAAAESGAPGDDALRERVLSAAGVDSQRGVACDCQGCHAPSPVAFAIALDPLAPPSVPGAKPFFPASVAREPRIPPPQSAL